MTEDERRRYFGVLVEDLYGRLKVISEGTISASEKKEMSTRMIYEFYTDYKEYYGIENIEEITKELDRVNNDMKKVGREREVEER